MTLAELVVVLGLLAAVATLALTSVDGLSDRSRADTTDRRLEQVRLAVTDFVNDMGRVPVVRDLDLEDSNGLELSELWDIQCEGTSFSCADLDSMPADYDEDVEFDGWRGPYLDVPEGGFFDGFGNPFCNSEGGEWGESDEVYGIGSLGRDGFLEGTDDAENGWENQDVTRDWTTQVMGDLTVILKVKGSNGSWVSPGITDTDGSIWQASETYKLDDLVRDEGKNNLYCCTHVGEGSTSSSTEPNGFSDGDPVVVDSDLVWSQRHAFFNSLHVVVFTPYAQVDETELSIRTLEAVYDGELKDSEAIGGVTANWTGKSSVTFTDIPVGLRYVLAYGYVKLSDGETYNAWTSGLQAVEVTSSANVLTVHLSDDLSEGND